MSQQAASTLRRRPAKAPPRRRSTSWRRLDRDAQGRRLRRPNNADDVSPGRPSPPRACSRPRGPCIGGSYDDAQFRVRARRRAGGATSPSAICSSFRRSRSSSSSTFSRCSIRSASRSPTSARRASPVEFVGPSELCRRSRRSGDLEQLRDHRRGTSSSRSPDRSIVGFGLALLLNRPIPAQGPADHAAAAADDAVAGRRRPVLEAASTTRPGASSTTRSGLGKFAWLSDPDDRALRHRASPTSGCGRPSSCCCRWPACRRCPSISTRRPSIDRAGWLYTFFRITLPLVAPLLLIALIFRTMEAFKTFDIAIRDEHGQPASELSSSGSTDGVPGVANRSRLGAGLHRPHRGAGDHQHLRQIPQQGEGALRWRSSRRAPGGSATDRDCRDRRRHADLPVADLLDRLDGLQAALLSPPRCRRPWCSSREITPFVKLFTKRVQLTEPPTAEVYDAAPWWEKAIYDGGERCTEGNGDDPQLSQYPNRFVNSADHGGHCRRCSRSAWAPSPPTASRASG